MVDVAVRVSVINVKKETRLRVFIKVFDFFHVPIYVVHRLAGEGYGHQLLLVFVWRFPLPCNDKVRRSTGGNLAHATQVMMTLIIGVIIGLAFAWQIGEPASSCVLITATSASI